MFVNTLSMIVNVLPKKQTNKKLSDFYGRNEKKKPQNQGWLSGWLISKVSHFCLLILYMKVSFPCKTGCKFILIAKAHLSNIPAHYYFHELDE